MELGADDDEEREAEATRSAMMIPAARRG